MTKTNIFVGTLRSRQLKGFIVLVLGCMATMAFYTLYSIQSVNKEINTQLLCQVNSTRHRKFKPLVRGNVSRDPDGCPTHIITLFFMGNTGNWMSQYATMFSYAKMLNYQPMMLADSQIDSYFKGLSIPHWDKETRDKCAKKRKKKMTVNSTEYKDTLTRLDKLRAPSERPTWIQLKAYGTAVGLIKHYLPEIKEEYRLEDFYSVAARKFLNASSSDIPDPVYVAIHVRRGDFIHAVNRRNGTLANRDYFVFALQQLKLKLPEEDRARNLVAVIVTNDYKWTEQNLANLPRAAKTVSAKNVSKYLAPKPKPSSKMLKSLDLQLMWECDHVIIDYGSYGLWGGLLAGDSGGAAPGMTDRRLIVASTNYIELEETPISIGLRQANMQNLLLIDMRELELAN